eukprot:758490-Hanusia_phi.AAC.1
MIRVVLRALTGTRPTLRCFAATEPEPRLRHAESLSQLPRGCDRIRSGGAQYYRVVTGSDGPVGPLSLAPPAESYSVLLSLPVV